MLHVASNPFEPLDDKKAPKTQEISRKLKTQGENSKSRHFWKRRVPEKRPKRKPDLGSAAILHLLLINVASERKRSLRLWDKEGNLVPSQTTKR